MMTSRVKTVALVTLLLGVSIASVALLAPRDVAASTPAFGPNVLVDDSGAATSAPRVAVDDAGNLHVIWLDMRNGNSDIYYSKSTDGGTTWLPSVRVDNGPGITTANAPDIALSNNGNEVYVVYHDNRNGNQDIWLARSLDGGTTWNPSVRVDDWLVGSGTSQTARVAVDDAGTVFVAFEDRRNATSPYQIYFAKSTNQGASFTPNTQVSDVPVGGFTWAPLAIDTAGTDQVYVAFSWSDSASVNSIVSANSSNGGGIWSRVTASSGAAGELLRSPDLATRTTGRVSLVYRLVTVSASVSVQYSQSSDYGASWTPPTKVDDSSTPSVQRYTPTVSIFLGDPYVVWNDDRLLTHDIFASGSQDGVAWGDCPTPCGADNDPTVNDVMTNDQSSPSSAATLFGLYAVWQDSRSGGVSDIYFARYVFSDVLITEFRNAPDGQEAVELVNYGGLPVDFTGWTLIVDLFTYSLSPLGTLPGGTIGGEYRVIGDNAGYDLVDPFFDMNDEGGVVELRDDTNALIDRVAWGQQGVAPDALPAFSSARYFDGSAYVDEWSATFPVTGPPATFGSLNTAGRVIADPPLILNEVYRHAPGGQDATRFIEVMYRGNGTLNTTGYRLLGNTLYAVLPAEAIDLTPANAFGAVENADSSVLFSQTFTAGDNYYLFDPSGNLLDEVGWSTTVTTGRSLCRNPDGFGDWDGYDDPTSTASGWVVGPPGCVPSPPLIAIGPSPQIRFVDIGQFVTFPLTVTNKQAITDTFDITVAHGPNTFWTVALLDAGMGALGDTDGDLIPDTGPLGEEVSIDINVRVSVPVQPPLSSIEFINVTATASLSAADKTALLRAQLYPHLETSKWLNPSTINVQGTGGNEIATLQLNVTARGVPFPRPVNLDVVLMIDSSGSMATADPPDPINCNGEACRLFGANVFVDQLSNPDRVSVVDFDSVCLWTGPAHHLDSPGHDGIPDYSTVKAEISAIDSVGATNLLCPFTFANQEFTTLGDPNHAWVEIFLTDGQDTSGNSDATILAEASAICNNVPKITIFTIGLLGAPVQLLQDIANACGGTFYPDVDPSTLPQIYSGIHDRISNMTAIDPYNNYTVPMIQEVLPSYISVVPGSYALPGPNIETDPYPDCLPQPQCWQGAGRTLPWNVTAMFLGDTWSVSFQITCTQAGTWPVELVPQSRAAYVDWNSSLITVPFPSVDITCVSAPVPPVLPVTNVTTTWNPASNQVTVSWDPPPIVPSQYLVYRASSPRGFASFASAAAIASVPSATTSYTESLGGAGEFYYIVRSSDAARTSLSETSNTAGVFFGTLNAGRTALSTPLEYFPWVDYSGATPPNTVGEYVTAFQASWIQYLAPNGSWVQAVAASTEPLLPARAYVAMVTGVPRAFAFTGLPGAMIRYDEFIGSGYDPANSALGLAATTTGDSVILTFPAPSLGFSDTYQVWYSTNSRAGFFDGSAQLVGGMEIGAVTDPMTVVHANALLLGQEVCYLVVPNSTFGLGESTYSVCLWSETFQNTHTFALPLHLSTVRTLDWYCSSVAGTLGMLWLTPSGTWVPHFTAMPSGTYDANVLVGSGYQIQVRSSGPVRYVFIGW